MTTDAEMSEFWAKWKVKHGKETMSEETSKFRNCVFTNLDGSTITPQTEEQFWALVGERNRVTSEIAVNAQWLRFAEAMAMSGSYRGISHRDHATTCADFAEAMVREARRRGRL